MLKALIPDSLNQGLCFCFMQERDDIALELAMGDE